MLDSCSKYVRMRQTLNMSEQFSRNCTAQNLKLRKDHHRSVRMHLSFLCARATNIWNVHSYKCTDKIHEQMLCYNMPSTSSQELRRKTPRSPRSNDKMWGPNRNNAMQKQKRSISMLSPYHWDCLNGCVICKSLTPENLRRDQTFNTQKEQQKIEYNKNIKPSSEQHNISTL